jgi:SpoIID/LytB domain protein
MAVSHGPYGGRWRAAVRATSHQVLLFRDKPAETLYFSTSNGHTYGNDEVFGSDPLPYLRPVPEHDDGASPLSHWEADISFRDLGRFLRAGGHWGKRRIDAVRQAGSTVRVRGGQTVKKIGVDDFRSTLNNWAHCLEPDRYPSFNADGRLPQTVPSHWLRLRTSGRTLMIRGRGWGHGIGMVQWGAYGKAKRGLSYRQILQAYYGGLSPHRYAEPDTIRIGIATGLKAVRLEAAGPVRVENRTAVPGPWLVTGGKHIHLEHSRGPLRRLPAARLVRAPRRVRAGKTFAVRVSVPQLSVLSVALEGEGTFVRLGSGSTHQPGPARLTALVPLSTVSGVYSLRAIATDGVDIVPSNPRRIRIVGGASPSPTPSPAAPSSRSPGPPAPAPSSNRSVAGFLIIGALAVVAAAALVFAALRSRPNRP